MKTHQLKLVTEPFEAIKTGSKTIESRLYDDKRQQIEPGDALIFTNREQPEQTITVQVVGLLRYETFKDLFTHHAPTKFGGESVEQLLSQIREFYSAAQEEQYGVIGIEFVIV